MCGMIAQIKNDDNPDDNIVIRPCLMHLTSRLFFYPSAFPKSYSAIYLLHITYNFINKLRSIWKIIIVIFKNFFPEIYIQFF